MAQNLLYKAMQDVIKLSSVGASFQAKKPRYDLFR